MCNMVYELTGTLKYGTKWVNQYRCWCSGTGLVYTQEQVRRVNNGTQQ